MAGARKGRFIVLEGLDGAGTTTQARRLVDRLEGGGEAAHLTREPSDGPVGLLLREILGGGLRTSAGDVVAPGTVALLFAADRLDHLQREILPRLEAGTHVVSDRYLGSSLAYQGSELDAAWVRSINAQARPADLTIFLDVDPVVAEGRRRLRGGRPERFEVPDAQRRIAQAYREVCREEALLGPVAPVDGALSTDAVEAAVWKAVRELLDAPDTAAPRP